MQVKRPNCPSTCNAIDANGSLQFQISVMDFVPGKALLVELLHEGIGIELLDIMNTWLAPQALAEHHGTNHGRHTCGVTNALHARLIVGSTV